MATWSRAFWRDCFSALTAWRMSITGLERFTDELRTPDACGLVRSSRLLRVASQGLSSALKGRSSIARGVNPGNARRARLQMSEVAQRLHPGEGLYDEDETPA